MTGVKTESEDHAADQLHPSTFFPAMFALLIVLAIFGTAFSAAPAAAQPYPSKPVRIITANSAGGTSDIFVRALGDELQKRWGHSFPTCRRSASSAFPISRRAPSAALPRPARPSP